jgi:transcriptional regulator with XRE-family HTH domain
MSAVERGQKLKKMRSDANYSQPEVAKLIGVTKQAVSSWEAGGRPDLENLGKLDLLYRANGAVLGLFGIEQRDEVKKLRDDVDDLQRLATWATGLLREVDARTSHLADGWQPSEPPDPARRH